MMKFSAMLLATAAAVSAFGQSYESNGKGDLTQGRDKKEIENARVVFTRSDFRLTLKIRRGRDVVVEGTATRINDRRNVKISSIDGRRVDGTGYILIERNDLKTVDVFGDSGDGRYSLKFRRDENDRPGDGRPPSNGQIEASGDTTGSGKYRLGRDEDDVRKITFILRENGFLSLVIDTRRGRDVTYTGRWTGRGDTRKFTLDGGWGKRVSGNGSLHLSDDRKEIRELEFNGKVESDRLSIKFKDK